MTEGDWVKGLEADKIYDDASKREWLEGLPLHSLIDYIFSIEKRESELRSVPRSQADRIQI